MAAVCSASKSCILSHAPTTSRSGSASTLDESMNLHDDNPLRVVVNEYGIDLFIIGAVCYGLLCESFIAQ